MRKLQCEVCVLLNRMLHFDNKIIDGIPFLFVALLFIFFFIQDTFHCSVASLRSTTSDKDCIPIDIF